MDYVVIRNSSFISYQPKPQIIVDSDNHQPLGIRATEIYLKQHIAPLAGNINTTNIVWNFKFNLMMQSEL